MLAVAVLITGVSLSDSLPSDFTIVGERELKINSDIPISANRSEKSNSVLEPHSKRNTFSVNLFGLIPVKDVSAEYEEKTEVLLSGRPFGIKIFSDGVMVVGITGVKAEKETADPAKNAGLKKGDVILKANDKQLCSNEDLRSVIENSGGGSVSLLCKRGEDSFVTELYPVLCAEDNTFKAGIWVRDSSAGIGTMTFIEPESGVFAGLGHSVCDADTGETLSVLSGQALRAEIIGITKGQRGAAGEIQGCFISNKPLGDISLNSECGVFGKYSGKTDEFEKAEVAMRQEVKKGDAEILSFVSGEAKRYTCKIEKISMNDQKQQNLTIKITDSGLLELTGGIVQGM